MAGLSQDLSQLLEVKIGELLERNGILQYSPGRLQKYSGKQTLSIQGIPDPQDGQKLAFEVNDTCLLCEPKKR